jgi:hypothetical protein
MTTTAKQRKPRSVTLYDVAGHLTIRIVTERKTSRYHVEPVPSDFGGAFEVTELDRDDAETYAVLLDGARSSCTCKGHALGGYTCKHIASLNALRNAGAL